MVRPLVLDRAQLISAREGMVHAEGNDTDQPTRMLQIWFEPNVSGGAPAYFVRDFPQHGRHVLAGDVGMPLRADARVVWADLQAGKEERFSVEPGRRGYLIALTSTVKVVHTGQTLHIGEGLEVSPGALDVGVEQPGAVLWLDVAHPV